MVLPCFARRGQERFALILAQRAGYRKITAIENLIEFLYNPSSKR
jgi:hypothetical protein